jgi:hypothetical protein
MSRSGPGLGETREIIIICHTLCLVSEREERKYREGRICHSQCLISEREENRTI